MNRHSFNACMINSTALHYIAMEYQIEGRASSEGKSFCFEVALLRPVSTVPYMLVIVRQAGLG